MGVLRKHGAHLHSLGIAPLAAGAASDLGEPFTFNAWPDGSTAIGGTATTDPTQYSLKEANVVAYAAHAGAATDFTEIWLSHYDATGAAVDQIKVQFNATGKTLTAFLPINLAVADAATVVNGGTAVLAKVTGTILPWKINFGDTIVLARISAGNGKASPAFGCTFLIGETLT
jgi:hypothetical protein